MGKNRSLPLEWSTLRRTSWALTIELFTVVIVAVATMFTTAMHFYPNIILAGEVGAYQSEVQ
jgi:hypothetical protein